MAVPNFHDIAATFRKIAAACRADGKIAEAEKAEAVVADAEEAIARRRARFNKNKITTHDCG